MKKKVLSTLTALALMVGMLPGAALAADTTNVASLDELRTAITEGKTDITITQQIHITTEVTLSASAESPVTITTGTIINALSVEKGGNLTLGNYLTIDGPRGAVLWAVDGGKIVVDGATIKSESTNGNPKNEGDNDATVAAHGTGSEILVISGAVECKEDSAVLAENGGKVTVAGGTVTGKSDDIRGAVGAQTGGTVVISGGTVSTTNSNGKYAVMVTGENSTAEITGGILEGSVTTWDYAETTITGGTIKKNVVSSNNGKTSIEGGTVEGIVGTDQDREGYTSITGGNFTNQIGTVGADGKGVDNVEIFGGTFTASNADKFLADGLSLNSDKKVVPTAMAEGNSLTKDSGTLNSDNKVTTYVISNVTPGLTYTIAMNDSVKGISLTSFTIPADSGITSFNVHDFGNDGTIYVWETATALTFDAEGAITNEIFGNITIN